MLFQRFQLSGASVQGVLGSWFDPISYLAKCLTTPRTVVRILILAFF